MTDYAATSKAVFGALNAPCPTGAMTVPSSYTGTSKAVIAAWNAGNCGSGKLGLQGTSAAPTGTWTGGIGSAIGALGGTSTAVAGTWDSGIGTSIIAPALTGQAQQIISAWNAGCGAGTIIHPAGISTLASTVWNGGIGNGATVTRYLTGVSNTATSLWFMGCNSGIIGLSGSTSHVITGTWFCNAPSGLLGRFYGRAGAITMWQSRCMPPLMIHGVWKLLMQPLTVVVETKESFIISTKRANTPLTVVVEKDQNIGG